MDKIILHTTHCVRCDTLKRLLDKEEISYREHECNVDDMINKGFMFTPILQVGDKYLTYEKAVKWIYERRRG